MFKSVNFINILTSIALAVTLSACGGGNSGANFGSDSAGTATTDTSASSSIPAIEVPVERIFSLQPLEIGLTALSAGGSAGLTTRIADQNGDLATSEFAVSFTSECISNGTSEVISPITSSNGVFTSTYTARGCEGDDEITATVGGLSVTGSVNVQAANLGSVEFISANPQSILLAGMSAPGFGHTSTVTFQILNNVGGPIADIDVIFELTTSVGGITLASPVGRTNNDGLVSVILSAGRINTPVRVRATVTRGVETISSESSQVSISTGIADQNSLSIALTNPTPSAWDHDGEEVGVTVTASDRFNNPVPDGTDITFNTELGQIFPNCQTVDGRCVVIWRSAETRSLGIASTSYAYADDGVSTITATVIGEESFVDTNSNGFFDNGDLFDTNSDKGESFEDYNDDNVYNSGFEKFLDFNANNMRDPKDGKYTGLGCDDTTGRCNGTNSLKHIFKSTKLIMSEDAQSIRVLNFQRVEVFEIEDDVSYTVEVSGARNGQSPPSGTTISIGSDEAEVLTESIFTVPITRSRYEFPLRVRDADEVIEEVNAFINIRVTTPMGLVSSISVRYRDIGP